MSFDQVGVSNNNYRHGLSGHPLFDAWYQMLRRCENTGNSQYEDYGGRGIQVCDQWHDPAVFIADIERSLGSRPGGCTLDRIDNDGNYEPGNVRWAPRSVQNGNQRRRPQRGYPQGASGYKGVRLHRRSGRFQARIYSGGREVSLGYYDSPEEAAHVYDQESLRLSGSRARLNFPEDGQ